MLLQMSIFDMPFVIEYHASSVEFRVVLHQYCGLLAFFSRPFTTRHLKLAAYEWELIGL